jgi:hypothetical protein
MFTCLLDEIATPELCTDAGTLGVNPFYEGWFEQSINTVVFFQP